MRTLLDVVNEHSAMIPSEESIISQINDAFESSIMERDCFIDDIVYDVFEKTLDETLVECVSEWVRENFKLQIVRK
jgi:hypothetical protein